ncbi:MAG: alanine--tRNA ligase [Imperialibacter sp.]|uniref:alanine--tRNA ligase n=1 Tax=Imperialibacter sp. TaxID=2038411 RepID=UPI003A86906D
MTAVEIRQQFLQFFESKGHKIVPSAPMVVQNDPTLMFTNAGMNQFKDYFLGNKEAQVKRIADTQKCLRVSGKHNDLEEVGLDTYHHTMFEMLGNWSFGDYFKKDAINWAWELLTEVYKLPKDRLYATVFGGDESESLEKDNEAFDLWSAHLPADRVLDGSKKDNFWEMGDTGPCGPCSELHIDLRDEAEIAKVPGREMVNMGHPQVVEIWNLVFIQFNRVSDGSLKSLPAKHVDTGMGFERLVMALQGKKSNYDTDVFQPMIAVLSEKAGVAYGDDEKTDIAMRVISDHIRAISFAIADGQLPSNVKAGYVIRRILRRAVRYGYTFLKFNEPFLHTLVPVLSDQFAGVFPELVGQKDFIAKVIFEEETSFLRTLDKGLKRIEVIKQSLKGKEISGAVAFELYDTYGFPLDLTALIARENGLTVDEAGFQTEMQQQKDRSKKSSKVSTGDWVEVKQEEELGFIGYDNLEAVAQVVKYREIEDKGSKLFQLVLDNTPFYAESGGQVGDKGMLMSGDQKIKVLDTKKENDLIIHFVSELPKDPTLPLQAKVDIYKRQLTENNHSATHLLHAALRQVLGTHVQQKGSLVSPDVLRFDFSHFAKMTDEEIREVEAITNKKIRENIALNERRNVPIAEAKQLGAMALFGEKYGEFVRVITFDPHYSVELCGGTHVRATGQIGFLKIVSESSVAAGVRRIEAVTADKAESLVIEQDMLMNEMKELLKNPKDMAKAVAQLLEEKQTLTKELEGYRLKASQGVKQDLLKEVKAIDAISLLVAEVALPDADSLKKLAYELRNELSSLAMVLAANIDGKPQVAVMFDDSLVEKFGLNAGLLVRDLAREIQGGGGGQPFFATAGGKDINGLPKVVEKANDLLAKALNLSSLA